MIFNSFTYLIFLAIVVILFWRLTSRQIRLCVLFGSSLVFYGFWRWDFIPVMLASVVVDYTAAQQIDKSKENRIRKAWLGFSLILNLGLLAYFKYTYFILDNFSFTELQTYWKIILPLGISFYTFQSISYTIDVYRRFIRPEKNFVLFATYVTFFPQLIAGPILRAREVIGQLIKVPEFNLDTFTKGLWLIVNGLFLKVILADKIAPFVDNGFAVAPETLSALDAWVLSFLFGFQIYFDFAAYSMIAIGSARLMGIEFPRNFFFPYFSKSPREFWTRWHITLSSWIRDYVYLPACGVKPHDDSIGGLDAEEKRKKVTFKRRTFALIGTWFVMGLWHGAAWKFAVWGLWHAALVLLQRTLSSIIKVPIFVGWLLTFLFVMMGWIWFRAPNLDHATTMLQKILNPMAYLNWDQIGSGYLWAVLPINIDPLSYLILAVLLIGHAIAYLIYTRLWPVIYQKTLVKNGLEMLYGTATIAAVFIYLQPVNQFIYFQF